MLFTVRKFVTNLPMAKSKFEYVKKFESDDKCLPNSYIVVRIDGKGFHRFSDVHQFKKPNDERSLKLMTKAAERVTKEFNDIIISYGQSDEYSFVFRRETDAYQRRASKLMTNVVSLFASSFVFHWNEFFHDSSLQYPPAFDARVILYPSNKNLRDYLSWRQADCHINNLNNTCFWKLVLEGGLSNHDAQQRLKTMLSSDKNEMLFSEFKTNYNDLPQIFRKGTVIVKELLSIDEEINNESSETSSKILLTNDFEETGDCQELKKNKHRKKRLTSVKKNAVQLNFYNTDIIGDTFWNERPQLLRD